MADTSEVLTNSIENLFLDKVYTLSEFGIIPSVEKIAELSFVRLSVFYLNPSEWTNSLRVI